MSGRAATGATFAAVAFTVLAVLAVLAFTLTRAIRAEDDLVNTVELSPALAVGGATIRFTLAEPESSVDVLVIDGEPGGEDAQVRALVLGADLPAGEQRLRWDLRADDGDRVPPGEYAIRVILGDAGRDILPPGRITVGPSPPPGRAVR